MNKKTYIIVLPLLVLAVAALVGCIRTVTGDSAAPADEQEVTGDSGATSDTHRPHLLNAHSITGRHVTVDPRTVAEIEEEEWVNVIIEMAFPPEFEWAAGPHDESWDEDIKTMDWDLYFQLREERWDELVSALGPDIRIGGGHFINAAGLEKLRNSPLLVSWVGGSYDSSFPYDPMIGF